MTARTSILIFLHFPHHAVPVLLRRTPTKTCQHKDSAEMCARPAHPTTAQCAGLMCETKCKVRVNDLELQEAISQRTHDSKDQTLS
ncbi:hypothetical protein B0T24DRAFT_600495 [Lasiosphaeria ovina]|uniref:Uncharacterized protein n=1 Tax=Lasiosphaeria ovina TaxID=92902 RepID=A0AAE0NII4_9PEZI|nr:hypothetical protein B0T24DRAFT_600495 [Lasiosphaeria ovina]